MCAHILNSFRFTILCCFLSYYLPLSCCLSIAPVYLSATLFLSLSLGFQFWLLKAIIQIHLHCGCWMLDGGSEQRENAGYKLLVALNHRLLMLTKRARALDPMWCNINTAIAPCDRIIENYSKCINVRRFLLNVEHCGPPKLNMHRRQLTCHCQPTDRPRVNNKRTSITSKLICYPFLSFSAFALLFLISFTTLLTV